MYLVPKASGGSAPVINPVEINGYNKATGDAFIPDYLSSSVGSKSGNSVYLLYGNIRQFDYNGSNISDGSGQWTLNTALSGVSTTVPTTGTMTAYASYFSNTVYTWTSDTTNTSTTYKNLAELVYPTSVSYPVNTNPATFKINSDFAGDTSQGTNFITHADVETPAIQSVPAYKQWEYPQSASSPGNKVLTPQTEAADPSSYNSTSTIQTYAPGANDATGQVPNQSSDFAYPAVSVGGVAFNQFASSGGNYGFFPGGMFNGSQSVYNTAYLNNTNWENVTAGGVAAGSFLVYNTKTAWTNPSGGAAGPPSTWVNNTPETNDPDFIASGKTPEEVINNADTDNTPPAATGTAQLSAQNATVKVGGSGLGELGIAGASTSSPFSYNGSTYTDPLSALEAVLQVKSSDIYGTAVTPSVSNWTVSMPGGTTSSPSTSQSDLFKAMTTDTTAGTVFSITFFSTATNSTITVTLGIVAGIITATNVSINTQMAAALAAASSSSPDNMVQATATAPGTASSPMIALVQQLSLIANNTRGQAITNVLASAPSSTPSSESVWLSGWKGPADTNEVKGAAAASSMTSELANATVGQTYTAYFQAVVGTADDGLDNDTVLSPSATTEYAVTITIVGATISQPADIKMTMSQAQALLGTDTSASKLSSDLVKKSLSNGVSGANMSSTLGSNNYGSNSVSVSNIALLYNGGSDASGQSITGLSTLIQSPLQADQTYTVTYLATNGLTATGKLTIVNTGSLKLDQAPSVNFGTYSVKNPPADWHNIPDVSASSSVVVDDSRNAFISNWQLTVTDDENDGNPHDLTNNTAGVPVEIFAQGNNSLPITAGDTLIYNDTSPIGDPNDTGVAQQVSFDPKLYLNFPDGQPTKSLKVVGTETLTWTLSSAP